MDADGQELKEELAGARLAAARRRPRLPAIDAQRCTGCGRCVAACAPQLLSLEVQHWKKRAVLQAAERCTGCSLCALRCPFDAIAMQAAPPAAGA